MSEIHNRVRAGTVDGCAFKSCTRPAGPCAGNCLLHRIDSSQLPSNRAVPVACEVDILLPIQFAGDEPAASEPPAPTAPFTNTPVRRLLMAMYLGLVATGICAFVVAVSFSAGFFFARHFS